MAEQEKTEFEKRIELQRAEIVAKLDALGPDAVRELSARGGLPSQWSAEIQNWLKGK